MQVTVPGHVPVLQRHLQRRFEHDEVENWRRHLRQARRHGGDKVGGRGQMQDRPDALGLAGKPPFDALGERLAFQVDEFSGIFIERDEFGLAHVLEREPVATGKARMTGPRDDRGAIVEKEAGTDERHVHRGDQNGQVDLLCKDLLDRIAWNQRHQPVAQIGCRAGAHVEKRSHDLRFDRIRDQHREMPPA